MTHGELIQGPSPTARDIDGTEVALDEEGFLVHPESWTKRFAEILAREDGLPELNDVHWRVIGFLRQYYLANGRAPLNTELRKGTGLTLTEIEACFPTGIRNGARRLAGLPNPTTWQCRPGKSLPWQGARFAISSGETTRSGLSLRTMPLMR